VGMFDTDSLCSVVVYLDEYFVRKELGGNLRPSKVNPTTSRLPHPLPPSLVVRPVFSASSSTRPSVLGPLLAVLCDMRLGVFITLYIDFEGVARIIMLSYLGGIYIWTTTRR